MSMELFVYQDNPATAIPAGTSVNYLLVVANSKQDADAIVARSVSVSGLTNYPAAGGTPSQPQWTDATFNLLPVLPKIDAVLNKGVGAPLINPGVLFEFQVTAQA